VIAESDGMRRGRWSGLLGGVLDGISGGGCKRKDEVGATVSGLSSKGEVVGVLTVPMT
jgi:hypothetical protein